MADDGTLERLTRVASQALLPLGNSLAGPTEMIDLLDDLGWEVPDSVTDLGGLGLDPAHVDAVADGLEAVLNLRDGTPSDQVVLDAYGRLLAAVAVLAQDIHDLRDSIAGRLDAAFVAASGIAEQLPKRLFDHLVVTWLEERNEPLLRAGLLVGVIELEVVDAAPATFTSQHLRRTIRLDRLRLLVEDPGRLPRDVYGWGTPEAELDVLIDRVAELGFSLGVDVELAVPPIEQDVLLSPPGTVLDERVAEQPEARLPLVRRRNRAGTAGAELGVSLYPAAPEAAGGPPGLALGLFGTGSISEEIPLDQLAFWLLKLEATLDLRLGVMVVARPGRPLRLLVDPLGAATRPAGGVTATLRRDAAPDEEVVLLGNRQTGIRAHGVRARAGIELRDGEPVLFVELAAEQGRAGIALAGSDSFLARVLPANIPDVLFDLGVTWSSRDGLALRGGAGLGVTLPAAAELGPLRLEAMTLAASVGEHGAQLDAGVNVRLALGPLQARVDDVGARFALTAPGAGGNAGPLDVRSRFKPPKGVGLELVGGPVEGGGYLFYDPKLEQYAGAMQLSASGISLQAVGLLTTRLPGGAPGFSLLIVVSAEFTPVQLGMGFTLNGVGGLLGINRTVAVDPLRAGLKTGALSSILFPHDPVGNAHQLVASLGTVFPPAAGRHVFGPMVRIGWGSPTIITIDLALVLELPAPVRLVILGRIRAVLPDEDRMVVRLQMDVLGVIDIDRREAAVDATLVDSWLAGYTLTGDMAMRLRWGDDPSFLLAVGGFHPRFLPPPGFPRLDRIAVALATGDNPRLRLEAYLALTSNTVQFGARLDLFAKAGPFSLAGMLAFDALVQVKPLAFVVDIAGALAVRAGGRTILSVTLKLTLSGPEPWHARGRASFSILFFDVTIGFDVTFGPQRPPALPASVEIGPRLVAALQDTGAWTAQLPVGGDMVVSLRELAPGPGVLAHPLGTLQVRQRVVPLERTVDRFGSDVVGGTRRFAISRVTVGRSVAAAEPLDDLFAPAQYLAMTDDEKLSRPSFERMRSGVRVGDGGVAHGRPQPVDVRFEERVVPAREVTR
jgi:hypothetical protein